jgi:hypothetical protein
VASFFDLNIEFRICICYNVGRQKGNEVQGEQRMNPPTVLQHGWGILLFFYSGKEPTRLFVALVITV